MRFAENPNCLMSRKYLTRRIMHMSQTTALAASPQPSLNIFGQPLSIFGVPVDRDTIFTNHNGVYKKWIEKRQRKLIVKTTFVKFFLQPDERILCLTTGYSPLTAKEQLITGPAFLFFKRAILIFTEKRILHIPTRFDHTCQSAISQIMYEDCADIELKGRSLVVRYKEGSQETFPYVGLREKKKIKALLARIPLRPNETGYLQERLYMCPSCTNVLKKRTTMCPACKLEFKSGFQAKLRSFLIPGGGYLYNRYNLFGFLIGLAELAIIVHLVFNWASFKSGASVNFGMMAMLASLLVGEKLITAFHSKQITQDFIPEHKDFAIRKI